MPNYIQPREYSKGGDRDGILYNLRNPNGNRYSLYLYRKDDGSWDWNYNWLDNDRNASNPTLGLANYFISSAFYLFSWAGVCFTNWLYQPPNIFPGSTMVSDILIYLLSSIAFISHATSRNIFTESSLRIALLI